MADLFMQQSRVLQPYELLESPDDQLKLIMSEASRVRSNDRTIIESLMGNFYGTRLDVGIKYQRAFGSLLSGDYFSLNKLPDGNYLFVFADLSGHGLPAYTNLIRLNSAIILALKEIERKYDHTGLLNTSHLIRDIITKFTDIMDEIDNEEFASVLFTFIRHDEGSYRLKFYSRGMLFPMIVRKYGEEVIDVYDLNVNDKGWFPQKGYLLGCALRDILGERYYHCPSCEFVLYEGDRALFFSDGIIETFHPETREEFGEPRVKQILTATIEEPPQATVERLFGYIHEFIGLPRNQKDDMTAVLIDFPPVR